MTAADPRYGDRDAITVLMAAKRKVAWRDGFYHLDGQPVTVAALNRAAAEITSQPFTLSAMPTFTTSGQAASQQREAA